MYAPPKQPSASSHCPVEQQYLYGTEHALLHVSQPDAGTSSPSPPLPPFPPAPPYPPAPAPEDELLAELGPVDDELEGPAPDEVDDPPEPAAVELLDADELAPVVELELVLNPPEPVAELLDVEPDAPA